MFAPVTKPVPTPQMIVGLAEQFEAAGDRVTAALLLGLAQTLYSPELDAFALSDVCGGSGFLDRWIS
jgi:hypothetical protein